MSESTPTVVLVHGAFADAPSWNGVIERLQAQGVPVVAVANSLGGISSDSAYVAAIFEETPGPVGALGHSYAGAVIPTAATQAGTVVGRRGDRRQGGRHGCRPRPGRAGRRDEYGGRRLPRDHDLPA